MTHGRYPGRRVRRGRPGLPGEGVTEGWVIDVENRLDLLEGAGLSVSTGQLTDVGDITGITDNQFLSWDDATDLFVPTTFPTLTLDFDIPLIFDGGGAAIGAKTWYDAIRFNFACEIRGFTLASPGGLISEAEVSRATYSAFPTYTVISGSSSQRPKLNPGTKMESFTLTGWTTSIAAGDFLRVASIAGSTSVYATLTLHMRRTLTLG